MITKLDLYKVFSQVVKSKSFSKAAKELYMTQPAVSQAIMALERELDIRLFNRTPKGVSLTNEGSLLFEYINSAMNLIKLGEEKILEFQNLAIGELKIGVGDTISKYFLVPFLEKFHNKYPNIKFKINNSTTLELCELLKVGDIFICCEKFKHLSRESIEFSEICKYPLIFLEPNSNSRKYVEKFLLSKGVKISPEFELGSYDLLLEFAKINLGVACVVKEFTKEYLDEGTIYQVKLKEDIPRRSIGICHLKSVPMSIASTKFVEIINNGI